MQIASALICLALISPVLGFPQIAQNKIRLPQPAGKYGIARIAYDWVDYSRPDTFSKVPGSHREIMVYVWYATKSDLGNRTLSEYLPHVEEIAKKLSSAELEDGWGSSWHRVFSKEVLTNTHESTPVAAGTEKFPLLVFSPGEGVPETSYTTFFQDVVSRGYVVASIEPTYESPAVGFSDGRVVHSSSKALVDRQIAPGESRSQFLARMHALEAPHLDRWAADIRFVIDQLSTKVKRSNEATPFADRIDVRKVGAWGHSIGGRAAVRACQLDKRIKACLNADGAGPDGPIFPYEGTTLPRQPFLWIEASPTLPPTDEILALYKITRQQWQAERDERLAAFERQLRSCPGGSYHLAINIPGIDHYSFTDWALLEAENKEDFAKAARALDLLQNYVIAFFDKHLRNAKNTLLDKQANLSAGITLQKYGKAR
jgi:predicted dienelactone hydrolase